MKRLRFVDLFAGLGGFHLALRGMADCVFASEIDDELRRVYLANFPHMVGKTHGDIRSFKKAIPTHDILCAGFPCQPFSKSGGQLGTHDRTRGTLFHEILDVLERHRPRYVLLENVGNFGRHDRGNTWRIVKQSLVGLGYSVRGTEHVTPLPSRDWRDRSVCLPRASGRLAIGGASIQIQRGRGLISPHHLGFPQTRGRFFIVGYQGRLPGEPFPPVDRAHRASLATICQRADELSADDLEETALTEQQRRCVDHWNALLRALPVSVSLPSFPIWGDEIDARYPYTERTPWATPVRDLHRLIAGRAAPRRTRRADLLAQLPSYAREEKKQFRPWKVQYIRQNRDWFSSICK